MGAGNAQTRRRSLVAASELGFLWEADDNHPKGGQIQMSPFLF
jgi:hypothetical protein